LGDFTETVAPGPAGPRIVYSLLGFCYISGVGLFIPVYLLAVSLTALTVGWAGSLAKKSGQKLCQIFFFFVIVNDLVSLVEILFRFLPARVGTLSGGAGPLLSGFLVFPLMAAFSYLSLAFQLELAGFPFPKLLKKVYAGYWGLLFCGFLIAEFRLFVGRDLRLTNQLMPFFNAAIIASGLGGSVFAFIRGGAIRDPRERRFVRAMSAYLFVAFIVFGALFFGPLRLDPTWRVMGRSLLGFAYLLPPLAWLQAWFRETKDALLTSLAGAGNVLDRWLEGRNLSPRERQIARCVLEGKSNKTIEQELFIGKRTVESHLYSIYQKLGVKSRLQLARLAAAETERQGHS
jgi:DNA-binding CsgD family transcriptional regulator